MKVQLPVEVFFNWLSGRPTSARVAVAIDSDRLLGDSGLLAKSTVQDTKGRAWNAVVFRGDDLAFRLSLRKASKADRVVLVMSRGLGVDKVDVSYVTDILARNESGPALDLSVPAFFRRICPKINFPVAQLRRYKEALLDRLENVPAATAKIVQRWGRPDDWGRGQVAALVLLAERPEWTLEDLWPDETDPAEFLAHAFRVILRRGQQQTDAGTVREVVREAARPQVQDQLFWMDVGSEELAAYLVLRLAADQLKLQNPSNQLAGLHIFSLDTPLAKMEKFGLQATRLLAADVRAWATVEALADVFLTTGRMEHVGLLLPSGGGGSPFVPLPNAPSVILNHQLRQALGMFFKAPSAENLAWVELLSKHPVVTTATENLSSRGAQCLALIRFARAIWRIEQGLSTNPPLFANADAVLDWYVEHGQHRLELELARAFHDIEESGDGDLGQAARNYLFGGQDDLAAGTGSLKDRVRTRLDQLDRSLATFVLADPEGSAKGPRSTLGLLKRLIGDRVAKITLGNDNGRAWVLLFDGMRFDTWETVVQPLLAEHFGLQGQSSFCVLPSYTQIARTSLFAGRLPSSWLGYKGAATKDEATLVAQNLGLTAQEAKKKLRFVTEADTTKSRMIMGFTDAEAADVNVLIYPISDECHEFRGDLAAFNNKIRTEILGDKSQGIRGILDDLLRRIHPEDTVLVTSDHGFTELLTCDAVVVSDQEAQNAGRMPQEDVRYRYTKGFRPAAAPNALAVMAAGVEHWLAVGRQWFRREGSKFMPRYWHGGFSLAEIAVPGYLLKRVTEKEARAELEDLNALGVVVPEDDVAAYVFSVRNTGNVQIDFQLTVRNNLGDELLSHLGALAPGAVYKATCQLEGKYRQAANGEMDPEGTLTGITIRLRHTDLKSKWRDALDGLVTIPVGVQAKATKLETDALKSFDDI